MWDRNILVKIEKERITKRETLLAAGSYDALKLMVQSCFVTTPRDRI